MAMYYVLLIFLYPLSLLPFSLLYLLSDVVCFFLFNVIGYRKKVVFENLRYAFPERNDEQIRSVMKNFYRSFCDQWIETLKLLSMPLSAIKERVEGNWDLLDQFYDEGKNIYILLGHQFNWEWGNVATQLNTKAQFAAIYLPQNSNAFDRLIFKIRSRAGSLLIPANDMRPAFSRLRSEKHIIGFPADQTPANLKIADWYLFMNRPAPFFKAPERSARRAHAAVAFVSLKKVKRGYYQLEFKKACDNAAGLPLRKLTQEYVSFLEEELRLHPENWMWTHRRWKRTMPEDAVLYRD